MIISNLVIQNCININDGFGNVSWVDRSPNIYECFFSIYKCFHWENRNYKQLVYVTTQHVLVSRREFVIREAQIPTSNERNPVSFNEFWHALKEGNMKISNSTVFHREMEGYSLRNTTKNLNVHNCQRIYKKTGLKITQRICVNVKSESV